MLIPATLTTHSSDCNYSPWRMTGPTCDRTERRGTDQLPAVQAAVFLAVAMTGLGRMYS